MAIPHISRRYRAQAVRAVSLSPRGERMTMDASMDQSRGKAKGKGRRVVMQFGYGRGHFLYRHPGPSWRVSLSHPQFVHGDLGEAIKHGWTSPRVAAHRRPRRTRKDAEERGTGR